MLQAGLASSATQHVPRQLEVLHEIRAFRQKIGNSIAASESPPKMNILSIAETAAVIDRGQALSGHTSVPKFVRLNSNLVSSTRI
jgi:hypothetical protein